MERAASAARDARRSAQRQRHERAVSHAADLDLMRPFLRDVSRSSVLRSAPAMPGDVIASGDRIASSCVVGAGARARARDRGSAARS